LIVAQVRLRAGDLESARKMVDSMLRACAENGAYEAEVLHFDSYLCWKEMGPEAAIERVKESLPKLSIIHRGGVHPGRARLMNLAGCLFDEVERYEESLQYFLGAHKEDPGEVIYVNNIVELYHKTQEHELSKQWAQRAIELGSESEIVRKVRGTVSSNAVRRSSGHSE
ncbi:MAG: hypothetical protein AAFV29_10785, partial [Myxococcota bacterium]